MRLVLSIWNLFEIGEGTDKGQREHRLKFLEQFGPLWVLERVNIQRRELQHFLWTEHFGVEEDHPPVFTPYLSVVDAYHAGPKARVGLTPRQWIAGVDFTRYSSLKDLAPSALRILQSQGKTAIANRQRDIFKAWIEPLIPTVGTDGKALSTTERAELLDYCAMNRKRCFAVCRCIAAEDAITTARVSHPTRRPRRSDGIDLMHSAVALAYCDYFLVRDKFSRDCADRARKTLKSAKLSAVYGAAEELYKDSHKLKRDAATQAAKRHRDHRLL
jgi:hypothetical protein